MKLFQSLLALALMLPALCFGVASTVTVASEDLKTFCPNFGLCSTGKKITVTATADSTDGSYVTKAIEMRGFIVKVVTNPGATAPTDNYDIALNGPEDTALDSLGGALANRDTANTEQVYPVISGATVPVYVNGKPTLAITGNSVNSAVTVITFYMLNP